MSDCISTLSGIMLFSIASGSLILYCCNGCGFQQKQQSYLIIHQQPPPYTEIEPHKLLSNI